jgi:plastocyanin
MMDARATTWAFGAAAILGLAIAACGGGSGSGSGTSPSPTPPSGSGPTITIANNAVSPKSITVPRGSQVTFVNNDSQSHDMASDPHPVHTDCPEINQVGLLNPGQSKPTATLNSVRTCRYHDHNRDMVESLQGTITIQGP